MPRRFAFALLALLVLLLGALLVARRFLSRGPQAAARAVPPPKPTPVVPPTPIPGRRVSVYFESPADEAFHPEAREVPAASDEIAFLRSVAAAVLDGPRRPELVRPFPAGWSLRGAYRLRSGLVVLDLSPAAPREAAPARWDAGSHEEESAAQALLISVAKNIPDATRVVILLGGEPAETLGGHLDLTHPLSANLGRAVDEPPLEPPVPPTPVPSSADSSPAPPPGPAAAAPPPAPTPAPSPTATVKPPPRTDSA